MLLSVVLFQVVYSLEMLMKSSKYKAPHELVLFFLEQGGELISIVLMKRVMLNYDSLLLKELKVDLLAQDRHDCLEALSVIKFVEMRSHYVFEWGLYHKVRATVRKVTKGTTSLSFFVDHFLGKLD